MRYLITVAVAILTVAISTTAQAFCGFYVARADTSLFNRASQVVLVHDDDRTVITMANDFQGDVEDFAVVIPVPTFIEREQINVAERALVEHLDAYTAGALAGSWRGGVSVPDCWKSGRAVARRILLRSTWAPIRSCAPVPARRWASMNSVREIRIPQEVHNERCCVAECDGAAGIRALVGCHH